MDYGHAYDLAQTVFANTLGDLPKPVVDLVAQIGRMLAEREKTEFTRRDVREFTRLPDHVMKRHMRTLEDLEYVNVTRAPNGGSFRYRMLPGGAGSPALAGLTPPEELARRWETEKAGQPEHHRDNASVPA